MIAEESTAWGGVSRPVDSGGLGFGYKWDMGWMHDTLSYFKEDPVHRRHHQDTLTFRMIYAWDENFVLSLSHDEVVHGKSSLVNKMPGDEWQQFANLRLLYGYMYAMPGKKLLFMGGELGQREEWAVDHDLDWWVLDYPNHAGTQQWTKALNEAYRGVPGPARARPRTGWLRVDRRVGCRRQRAELPAQRPQRRKTFSSPGTSHRCFARATASACLRAANGRCSSTAIGRASGAPAPARRER